MGRGRFIQKYRPIDDEPFMKVIPSLSWNWLRVLLPPPTLPRRGARAKERERNREREREREGARILTNDDRSSWSWKWLRGGSWREEWTIAQHDRDAKHVSLLSGKRRDALRLWVNKDIRILIDHVRRCVRIRIFRSVIEFGQFAIRWKGTASTY